MTIQSNRQSIWNDKNVNYYNYKTKMLCNNISCYRSTLHRYHDIMISDMISNITYQSPNDNQSLINMAISGFTYQSPNEWQLINK